MAQTDQSIDGIELKSLENVSTSYALMYSRLVKSILSYAGTSEIRRFDIGTSDYLDRVFPVKYSDISTCVTEGSLIPSIDDMRFLSKHAGESDTNYSRRVQGSWFFGAYRESIAWQTGRIFSREVQIPDGEKVPEVFAKFAENVNKHGDNLNKFCENVFRDALIKGFSSVLVDFDSGSEDDTFLDDMHKMPTFVHVKPENLIAAYRNNEGELYHARIMTKAIEIKEDYSEISVRYINLFEKREDGVYFYKFRKSTDDVEYQLVEGTGGLISLDYIPLVTFYASEKEDDFLVNNILNDLSDLAISHYRQTSAYLDTIEKTAFPMLLAKGFADDEFSKFGDTNVGASRGFVTSNESANLEWVEYAGTAVESAAKAIADTEEKMAVIGSDILSGNPGNMTATARAIDSAEQNSRVESLAKTFQNFLARCLSMWSDWMLLNRSISDRDLDLITANVHSDFSFNTSTIEDAKELREMVRDGLLSREQYIERISQLGRLGQDFDSELNSEQLLVELDVSFMNDKETAGETDTIEEQTLRISAEDAKKEKDSVVRK